MTLIQLQYFRVMSTTLHYTKAATSLHISQPSLSYALSQLEAELEVPLFIKIGKKVFLTRYGEAFKIYAENIITEVEKGLEELNQMKENTMQEIRLGYIQSLSPSFVPDIINKFYHYIGLKTIPFKFLPNQQYDLIKELKSNKLDVVFAPQTDESLRYSKIGDQELKLVVSKNHPFALKDGIFFNELDNQPLIMLQQKTKLYRTVEKMFLNHQIKMNVVNEAYDYNAAINYVTLGIGVSFLPQVIVTAHPNLALVTIKDENCSRPIYLLYREEHSNSTSTNEFVSFILKHYLEKISPINFL
ncbi:MAG: LysR family transcriptional regulator [Dethiosulfatibacter sp.]|nr:LysR family transcriptional regulator [Dethiosulfatibacter sp.]